MILPSKKPHPTGAVSLYAEAPMPTRHGEVRVLVYREVDRPEREHVAIQFGPALQKEELLVRVHSECLTSEVFGSLKCDCKDQLDFATEMMATGGSGLLIYLRQEGRGIGLGNKIRAYALQAKGADTIQANHQLGFETDLRTYDTAAGVLHDLGVKSIRLLTNNPLKLEGLEKYGVAITERVAIQMDASEHSKDYLDTKLQQLGHLL